MKYYCENCGTEYNFKDGAWDIDDHCPICGNDDPDYILIPIPDYETPAEYKARTGREPSGEAQVWWKYARYGSKNKADIVIKWHSSEYSYAKYHREKELVVIGGPEPPPDDWRRELEEAYFDPVYPLQGR
jgi:hypothetical protein